MKNVTIIGSGAVAAELTSYIEDNNKHEDSLDQFNILGYLEFEENISKYWARYKHKKPVIGDINSYEMKEDDHFIIAISNIDFKKKILNILQSKNANVIGFVHRSSLIAESSRIGKGNLIYPFCIVGPNAELGDHNLLTSYSFISHDCRIGNNNFFASAGLSGNVTIGSNNFFGIRATVLPDVSLGSGNIIQAGMIVDKDIPDNTTVFHRFKEKIISFTNRGHDEQ
jgi:sugar O-acyltransferase (sialic acid O-acetyltransferase NeuD family)